MIHEPDTTFDDHDDDPDDSAAIEAYALELEEAVKAFGLTVKEPGQRNEDL